jgi:hypothetical protein
VLDVAGGADPADLVILREELGQVVDSLRETVTATLPPLMALRTDAVGKTYLP